MKREIEVVDVVIDARSLLAGAISLCAMEEPKRMPDISRLLAMVDDLLARTIDPLHDAELTLSPPEGV